MPWKRSEEVRQGDYVRDVGRVVSVAQPDQHGRIPMSVAVPPGHFSGSQLGSVSDGGRTGGYQPATLGVGGVVEVETNPRIV